MSHQNKEAAVTQSPDAPQDQQLQDSFSLESMNRLALLRLNSFNSKQGNDQNNNSKQIQCQPFAIGSNSMKRRSPCSSITTLQDPSKVATESDNSEPKPKRLFCEQEDHILPGFSVISLPVLFPTETQKSDSSPVLRRCTSDPYNPPAANIATNPMTELQNSCVQSPDSVNAAAPSGSGLPPLPRCLRRSVSDPTSSPKPLSPSSSSANIESSDKDASDRKKRMTSSLREMRKWLKEIIHEEEQEEENKDAEHKEIPESKGQGDCGRDNEHVYVDKVGDCLVLRFKCPCGQGYEILLSGSHCYYKLL